MKAIMTGFIVLALAGCVSAADEAETERCGAMECVALGEAQQVGRWDGDLVVTPLQVLEDSRCPTGAQCVWAGRVRLSARLTTGTETIEAELTTERPHRINGGMLSIGEVVPSETAQGQAVPATRYRFGFLFAPDRMAPPSVN